MIEVASRLLRWASSWEALSSAVRRHRHLRDIIQIQGRYKFDAVTTHSRPSGNNPHDRNAYPAPAIRALTQCTHAVTGYLRTHPKTLAGMCREHALHFRMTRDSSGKPLYIPLKDVTKRYDVMAIPVLRPRPGIPQPTGGQERQMSTRAQSSLLPTSRCSVATRSPAPDRNPCVTRRSASPRSLSMPASISRPGASTRPSV